MGEFVWTKGKADNNDIGQRLQSMKKNQKGEVEVDLLASMNAQEHERDDEGDEESDEE